MPSSIARSQKEARLHTAHIIMVSTSIVSFWDYFRLSIPGAQNYQTVAITYRVVSYFSLFLVSAEFLSIRL